LRLLLVGEAGEALTVFGLTEAAAAPGSTSINSKAVKKGGKNGQAVMETF